MSEPATDAPTLWAARDSNGSLYIYEDDPLGPCNGIYDRRCDTDSMLCPEEWCQAIPPGHKQQVRLVAVGDVVKGGK